jgi:SAM-dependent methyltransferase
MEISCERYHPMIDNPVMGPYEPYISYEHYHRYLYAIPFVIGKNVLDIACGEGYGSALLAPHAALVVGVDVSAEAIEHARRKYVRDNLRFLRSGAEFIPIPEHHSFDTVVSFETIEHLDEPTQEEFALEVKRLLKSDGVLLMSTPNRLTYTPSSSEKNPYHLREFSTEEFLQFLRGHFETVCLLSQHVYPVSYIWNMAGPNGSLTEYQMALDNNVFRPVQGDNKEIGYLIAVCTDRKVRAATPDSLLLDLTEVAFRKTSPGNPTQVTSLFIDSGQGFREEEVTREQVAYGPDFTITFTLDSAVSIRALRWDPLETRLCQLRLREVHWQDGMGTSHSLRLDEVSSNGTRQEVGTFHFETLDPMVFLPITGTVASVTLTGECHMESETASLIGLHQTIQNQDRLLAQREEELQAARAQVAASLHVADNSRRQLLALLRRLQVSNRCSWPWVRAV